MLKHLKGWSLEDGKLVKLYPDLAVGYNKCRVEYSTHAIDGLVVCGHFRSSQ